MEKQDGLESLVRTLKKAYFVCGPITPSTKFETRLMSEIRRMQAATRDDSESVPGLFMRFGVAALALALLMQVYYVANDLGSGSTQASFQQYDLFNNVWVSYDG